MSNSLEQTQYPNDEIDLIELIISLWKEKISIITATLVVGIISVMYAFTLTPIYSVSAEITPPSQTELSQFEIPFRLGQHTLPTYSPYKSFQQQQIIDLTNNQQHLLKIIENFSTSTPTSAKNFDSADAFSLFLSVLNSNSHIVALSKDNENLLNQAFNINADGDLIGNIVLKRKVGVPKGTFSISGINRESLKKLIGLDLSLASKTATAQIKHFFIDKITQEIVEQKNKQQYALNTLSEKINARKSYLLAQRANAIEELNKALKIATILNIQNPTNTLLLSTKDQEVKFSAELSPPPALYLKGKKLLQIEIDILTSTDKNKFSDNELWAMDRQKTLLTNNSHTKQLETEKERLLKNTKLLTFYSSSFNAPKEPIKSKKYLIITIGIMLGVFIGLFVAAIRMVMRKYKSNVA